MTSTPGTPEHDGSDLQELREEIDELKALPPTDETSPFPARDRDEEPEPEPTDAIGSEDWNTPSRNPHPSRDDD